MYKHTFITTKLFIAHVATLHIYANFLQNSQDAATHYTEIADEAYHLG